MSSATAANNTLPYLDPKVGLMLTAADQLIPMFRIGTIDRSLAREMAISAMQAYCPETRADYVNIARTIAFSMAALALLGNAASQDVTYPEKMQAFGRANALNRSADQSERTMMQRQRYQRANPFAEQPDSGPPEPAIEADVAAMQAQIAAAMQEYLAARRPDTEAAVRHAAPECAPVAVGSVPSKHAVHQPASPQPAGPQPVSSQPVSSQPVSSQPVSSQPVSPDPAPPRPAASRPQPIVSPIPQPVAAPATAIHRTGPRNEAGQPGTTTFKASLLRQSALQRVLDQDAVARSA